MPRIPKPGDVLISLSNGAYSDGTRVIKLRIEDETTSRFIVDVDMDGPRFAGFVTCTGVQVGSDHLTLSSYLNSSDHGTRLDIRSHNSRFGCALTGEQLAAILGNAVTRVSGATFQES